jgi:hypothetical protein
MDTGQDVVPLKKKKNNNNILFPRPAGLGEQL